MTVEANVPRELPQRRNDDEWYLTGEGLKEAADGTMMPANSVPGNEPNKWAEFLPDEPGAMLGQTDAGRLA